MSEDNDGANGHASAISDAAEPASSPPAAASTQPLGDGNASPELDRQHQSEPTVTGEEAEKMLDVRMPHVHAPHDEVHSWRSFFTHIAIVAIGLLLALGLEQGVEYVHHEFQRERLEAQMHETFESNLRRTEKNIQVLDNYSSYLIDLRNAVVSRIGRGSNPQPKASDPRNFAYAPPPNLGSYEASKINGSVSLLSLNRIRLFDRIEFQHDLMLRSFHGFYDSLGDLEGFSDRFNSLELPLNFKIPQPNIADLSPVQLVEYQVLIAKSMQYTRAYSLQMRNLKTSYELMLRGVNDADTLTDELTKARGGH